jgi:hypothetical protein
MGNDGSLSYKIEIYVRRHNNTMIKKGDALFEVHRRKLTNIIFLQVFLHATLIGSVVEGPLNPGSYTFSELAKFCPTGFSNSCPLDYKSEALYQRAS